MLLFRGMSLFIGKHKIGFPYVLAPMAGITNAPFRLLMRKLNASVVISELISSTGLQYESSKTKELCFYFEEERPVGLQIFGENKDHLALAAATLEKKGVDFIDINLGCPVPKVVKKGGGSAWLKDPTSLFQMLSFVKKSISIPLTIKIRTGWDSCSVNALECVQAASEAGVHWVSIHGRTKAQGYEGEADWELISQVKEKSKIPILGNGDVLTAAQAIEKKKISQCDAIMIGRGALRNPFIFEEIAVLEGLKSQAYTFTYWDLILKHTELLKKCSNDFFLGIQLRKFLTWYSAGIEGASQFRKNLYSSNTSTEMILDLAKEFFNKGGIKKQNSYLTEPFLRGGHG